MMKEIIKQLVKQVVETRINAINNYNLDTNEKIINSFQIDNMSVEEVMKEIKEKNAPNNAEIYVNDWNRTVVEWETSHKRSSDEILIVKNDMLNDSIELALDTILKLLGYKICETSLDMPKIDMSNLQIDELYEYYLNNIKKI